MPNLWLLFFFRKKPLMLVPSVLAMVWVPVTLLNFTQAQAVMAALVGVTPVHTST